MPEMKWTLGMVTIDDIVVRKKKNPYTKNEEEYAVVKVLLEDRWDTFRMAHTRYKKERPICLMCFREEIFKRLVIGETFSFGGRTNFPPGNTYHQIKHAFDSLGFDVESEQSAYFAFPSSPGDTCSDCKHFKRCKILIGITGEEETCDWFPTRFEKEGDHPCDDCEEDCEEAEKPQQKQTACERCPIDECTAVPEDGYYPTGCLLTEGSEF